MSNSSQVFEALNRERRARFILDIFHRILVHYALWFTEIRHKMGTEKAMEMLGVAWERSYQVQMRRLSKLLGCSLENDMAEAVLNMPVGDQRRLLEGISANWLANDGVWFQAVEFSSGMVDAKRCNDTCWAHFSPFEAWSIKRFASIPENAGLEGLKTALEYRIYALINRYSIMDEGPNAFTFQMNDCRVQSARKRKGLEDYPCKSGGTVEYNYFAKAMDPCIRVECIGCPPDKHPDEWFCCWRFFIPEAEKGKA